MITTLFNIIANTLRYKFFKVRTPIVLSISITSRCNLKCAYCYSLEDNRTAKDVPAEEVIKTIDEFYSLGTRVVMLQGGEPLLHKDLDDIVNHVKSKNMYCAITTNSLDFGRHIPTLRKMNQVQLSIDGNREITDRNRGRGVYDALLEAIKLCRDNRIPFHLHIVVTKDSTAENTLEPLRELADKYNTYLNFCIPAPAGSARGKDLADNKQVKAFYKIILDEKNKGLPTNNTRNGITDIIEWGDAYSYSSYIPCGGPSGKKKYSKCVMGNLVCWLDSEGLLHPCAIRFGQRDFSYSIKEFGVRGAWERLKDIPCHYCANSTEFNNLFNFKIGSVINSLKFIFKRPLR